MERIAPKTKLKWNRKHQRSRNGTDTQKIKLKQNGKKLKQSRKRQRPSRNGTENIKDQEMEWKHQYEMDSTKD